ncbi:MAG: hypothetical protein HONBIEJF_01933 [Fimbriimonadaceae bacterium]|nr:hypothetical protein [Fimbriimonadaceae bacterium]
MYISLLLFVLGCQKPPQAKVQSPPESKRVLVVMNRRSPESTEIASYYVRKRIIPSENVVDVDCSTTENVTLSEFTSQILNPVKKRIGELKHQIDFIVTTKGVPLRLDHDFGFSLDSHLMAMNLGITPIPKLEEAAIKKNISPYFQKNESFSSKRYNMYLVCRLDGYEVEHVKRMIDNSLAAKPEKGKFFFDSAANRKSGDFLRLEQSMARAEAVLKAKGFEVELEKSSTFAAPSDPVAGYASWGSNDGAFSPETYHKIKFKPGAICETFVSTSGRTFRRTTGGQSLIADLIEQGVTGIKGYVSEPFTFSLAIPDVMFDRYTSGFNLAESIYMASPILMYKDVVIGDPLCNPYKK